jgi:hypothetical protein
MRATPSRAMRRFRWGGSGETPEALRHATAILLTRTERGGGTRRCGGGCQQVPALPFARRGRGVDGRADGGGGGAAR